MTKAALPQLSIAVVDSARMPVRHARLRTSNADGSQTEVPGSDGAFVLYDVPVGPLALEARADGFLPQRLSMTVRDPVHQVILGLPRNGERSYTRGQSRLAFVPDPTAFLLLARGPGASAILFEVLSQIEITPRAVPGRRRIDTARPDDIHNLVPGVADVAAVIVEALPEAVENAAERLRERKVEVSIVRPIFHADQQPLGLGTDAVGRFAAGLGRQQIGRLAAKHGFEMVREVRHAGNAFLLRRPGTADYDVLDAIDALRTEAGVIYVEPDFVIFLERHQHVPNDPLWAGVPHLHLIKCDAAWERLGNVAVPLRGGSPGVTIAVIDPGGVAPDHPDLVAPLTDITTKMVANVNFVATPFVDQTVAELDGHHGTQCAGTATAAFDDMRGLPGVAPNCHLIGARVPEALNETRMIDTFLWAAGFANGAAGFPALPTQPADVISASFAPAGVGNSEISDAVRDCFDFLTTYGRGGRGCVICFSISNTGYVDFTYAQDHLNYRPWPTYARTIAVGSSINVNPTNPIPASIYRDPTLPPPGKTNIPTQVDRRSLNSPYGSTQFRKPDVVAPSSTTYTPQRILLDPILSCVQVGMGNVNGCVGGAACFDYAAGFGTDSFGGTSASCPIAAGVAALILSARPELSWLQVRDILHRSAERIDPTPGLPLGQWQDLDADGVAEFSPWYGYGRVDADAAVAQALDMALPLADTYVRENLGDIGDVPSTGWHAESPDIWVRRNLEPIPALAWNTAPPHENPLRGQDNYIFCRVRNRGSAAAEAIHLRAMISHYPGFEFLYPQDFQPSSTPSGPFVPGTYLIGEQQIDSLAPNSDTIVRIPWSHTLIPPATITVGGLEIQWHPCLLLEASPHDGPAPAGGVIAVRADNNIAQRNIHIDDVADDSFVGVIAGTRDAGGVGMLIVDASNLEGDSKLRLRLADDKLTRRLADAAMRHCDGKGLKISAVKHQGVDTVEFRGLRGRTAIPMELPAGTLVPLLVAIVGSPSGELRLNQRRGDGALSGGYTIRRR